MLDVRVTEVDAAPLGGVPRMWADEDARVRKQPAVGPQRRDPVADERHLVRRHELRRADVEDDRPARFETHAAQNSSRVEAGCQSNQWS